MTNKKYQSPDFFIPKFTRVEENSSSVFFGRNPTTKEKIDIAVEHNPDEVGVFRDKDLPPEGLNAVERAIWQAKRKK